MKRVISFMLLFLMCCTVCMPISVFGVEVDTIVKVPVSSTMYEKLKTAFGDISSELGTKSTVINSDGKEDATIYWNAKTKGACISIGGLSKDGENKGGTFLIYKENWNKLKDSERSKAMRKLVDNLSATVDPDVMQDFMSSVQEQNTSVASVMLPLIFDSTKGDMYQAYKITSPFLNILSVVLGVGAVLLILLLLFSTVMDLAYIGLPVWREANANKDGGNKQPFGVSYEALTTVKSVEKDLGGGDYKNAYVLYFKRRALTYIILAICIMYLIGGGLSGIIGFILSLVSGITG